MPLVSYESFNILKAFSNRLLKKSILFWISLITWEKVHKLIVRDAAKTSIFSFFILEKGIEMLLDAFNATLHWRKQIIGLAL